MRILAKFFLALAAAGLLFVSMQAGAAEPSKAGSSDQLNMCREGCKSSKDNSAYESCMIQCQQTYKKTKRLAPNSSKKEK